MDGLGAGFVLPEHGALVVLCDGGVMENGCDEEAEGPKMNPRSAPRPASLVRLPRMPPMMAGMRHQKAKSAAMRSWVSCFMEVIGIERR